MGTLRFRHAMSMLLRHLSRLNSSRVPSRLTTNRRGRSARSWVVNRRLHCAHSRRRLMPSPPIAGLESRTRCSGKPQNGHRIDLCHHPIYWCSVIVPPQLLDCQGFPNDIFDKIYQQFLHRFTGVIRRNCSPHSGQPPYTFSQAPLGPFHRSWVYRSNVKGAQTANAIHPVEALLNVSDLPLSLPGQGRAGRGQTFLPDKSVARF